MRNLTTTMTVRFQYDHQKKNKKKKKKMNNFLKNNIPVFYHIPKCAGSFVRACHEILLDDYVNKVKNIEVVQVIDEDLPILEIVLESPLEKKTNKNIFLNELNEFLELKKENVFAVAILSNGIKKQNQITSLLKENTGRNLTKYAIIRDPLDREVSFYNYIKSSFSNHEKKPIEIKSKSLKEFLSSEEIYDSLLITGLLSLKKEDKIGKKNYDKVCNELNQIEFFDIKETKKAVKKIFKKCYNIKKISLKNIQKNESIGKKIKLEDLDSKTEKKFKEKKFYEYEFIDKYIKKKINPKKRKELFALPRKVRKEECSFNHIVNFENGEVNNANWDFRHCINKGLRKVNFKGKRVIDVGAGCGYPSFIIEKMGAEVVSHEIPDGTYWDKKIYPNCIKTRKSASENSINAYWYNHNKFKSKNKLFLWDLYKELPRDLGEFDIAVFSMVISHMRDPMLALMNVLCKTRERVVIINPFPHIQGTPFAIFSGGLMDWWHPSFQCIREMLLCIGFKIESVTEIKPKLNGKEQNYKSIVFKRI
jgi:2-polyprenyl-3-methyl-5-hydroxy-6-metoxy-1,4-benzoquinol methylase